MRRRIPNPETKWSIEEALGIKIPGMEVEMPVHNSSLFWEIAVYLDAGKMLEIADRDARKNYPTNRLRG